MDHLITFLVAVVPAVLAYIGARYQAKQDVKKLEMTHKHEIEKLEKEIDKQAELYEKNKQQDFMYDFMGNFSNGQANQALEGIKAMGEIAELMESPTFKKMAKQNKR